MSEQSERVARFFYMRNAYRIRFSKEMISDDYIIWCYFALLMRIFALWQLNDMNYGC